MSPEVPDDHLEELAAIKSAHTMIQDQIDELILGLDDMIEAEEPEKDKDVEALASIRTLIRENKQLCDLWHKSNSILNKLVATSAAVQVSSSTFRRNFEKLTDSCDDWFDRAAPFTKTHGDLDARSVDLRKRLDDLNDVIYTAEKDIATSSATTPAPSAAASATAAPSTPHSQSIHLNVPTFDGDPFNWEHFETMFRATIKTRAKNHSNLEIRGHLTNAIRHPDGQDILRNIGNKDADLDEMLKLLRDRFGSTRVVCPLIVQKISSVRQVRLKTLDLKAVIDNVVLPARKFKNLVGNDLTAYLAVLMLSVMDEDCKREWHHFRKNSGVPDLEDVHDFAQHWIQEVAMSPHYASSTYSPSASSTPSAAAVQHHKQKPNKPSNKTSSNCPACEEHHALFKCSSFLEMSIESRNKLISDHHLCINCFSNRHGQKNCPSKYSCKTCGAKHHTLIHTTNSTSPTSVPKVVQLLTQMESFGVSIAADGERHSASLMTFCASVSNNGVDLPARAALDSGSTFSVITEKLAADLKLKRIHDPVVFLGCADPVTCKFAVRASLTSLTTSVPPVPFYLHVVPKIPFLKPPARVENIKSTPGIQHYKLADPELGGATDILLSLYDAVNIFTGALFKVDDYIAQPTVFGLCISGLHDHDSASPVLNIAQSVSCIEPSPHWDDQVIAEAPIHSPTNLKVLKDFDDTNTRVEGRFAVSLPRVDDPPPIGDTRRQAMSRLLANERSLSAKGKLEAFSAVMQEYLDLGHAVTIPPGEIHQSPSCYLPVHGVFKDSSSTTKVRAVFDASARSSTTYSLNDTLLPGPNLYPPLTDVLTRFRLHSVGMTADISKMFREILLNPDERDYHRFLMRNDKGTVVDCRMHRLTFGVKSSPFLATQVLHTLANLYSTSHPEASQAILNSFYVDDFISGANSVEEANKLRVQLCDLLDQAHMTLRKWRSNSKELKDSIPTHLLETDKAHQIVSRSCDAPKALGVHWAVEDDTIHVSISKPELESTKITKRSIASVVAGVFDVLGLFCPVIISARILYQSLWKLSLTWDKPVPPDIVSRWLDWQSDLHLLNEFPVPRRIVPFDNTDPSQWSLHGFADASQVAYGACIYLLSVTAEGTVASRLVIAKARVLPIKPTTIPKAELRGALLLAQLIQRTAALLNIPLDRVFTWLDSEVVLHWLPKAPTMSDRFIANRVFAIQELLPDVQWRHVRSKENPADLASRGVRAQDLLTSSLWWSGPPWLSHPPDQWPNRALSKPAVSLLKVSIKPCLTLPDSQDQFLNVLWKKFSSFAQLVRVIAWLFRFKTSSSTRTPRSSATHLTCDELEFARFRIFLLAQMQTFYDVFDAVRKDKPLPDGHALRRFTVAISVHRHLIVQSRVRDPKSPRTPSTLIPLSARSDLTKLLVSSLHRTHSHAGISAMISILASTFWIPGLRNLLKIISRTCVSCQKAYSKPLISMMGMLPSSRTTPAPPFCRTGVDFSGPYQLKVGYTRKPSIIKAYAVHFVCMATKAIHLDLCSSLSTPDFRATLDRFVARRGCPTDVYSDNGTNFQGAREEIRDLQKFTESEDTKQVITIFSSQHNIKWHHIPPRAPHFGGLWEASVKATKMLLRKVMEPHPLRWDEMYTLLTQVEAVLNSRPIAPLGEDEAMTGRYLTPGTS